MVMNMYSLLLNDPTPSKQKIENSFDGHICRCTGYRPILDAMKSFADDEKPIDIEDCNKVKCMKNASANDRQIRIIKDNQEWFVPQNIDQLKTLLKSNKENNYSLVGANTSTGIYKEDGPYTVFINLQNVSELYGFYETSDKLMVGACLSLSKLIEIFGVISSKSGFEYLSVLSDHIAKIANVSVRNIGTWSGNLGIKHKHSEFPSDVFICLQTAGALLTISSCDQPDFQVLPSDFLKLNMRGRFISSALFPKYDKTTTLIKTYKIMPRSQNAHAYVNAGFRFKIDPSTFTVQETPTIVFGGVNESFFSPTQTTAFLFNKKLNNFNVVQQAFSILNSEIVPHDEPVLSSPAYRKSLAVSLFYKFVLFANDASVDSRYRSACTSVIDSRPVSTSQRSFPSDPSMYPVTEPMTKLNALMQTSGEAGYVYDMPEYRGQLHGVFILSKFGNCRIDSVNSHDAESIPGVRKIIFAKDIPGVNSFMPIPLSVEQLFCDDQVMYAGQAVGLVIADSYKIGQDAANAVKITYKDMKPPILTIADAIAAKSFHPKPFDDFIVGDAEDAIANAPFKLRGNCFMVKNIFSGFTTNFNVSIFQGHAISFLYGRPGGRL
jgi:xanthine dehydrogenase/oxidase